jgi:hypothetical protein
MLQGAALGANPARFSSLFKQRTLSDATPIAIFDSSTITGIYQEQRFLSYTGRTTIVEKRERTFAVLSADRAGRLSRHFSYLNGLRIGA